MLVPLAILAIFSIVSGFAGIPAALHGGNHIEHFLAPAAGEAGAEAAAESHESATTEIVLMAVSTGAALAGLFLAYLFYVARPELPAALAAKAHAMYSIMLNKYYVDELYDAVIVWPIVRTSREFLWRFVDAVMIDGAVNGVGALIRRSGGGLRRMQTGYVRTYAGWILLGGVLVMAWFLR
jgi:NADH-quinone oxidoreductase subunit L